jgi:hypothetical protein
MELGPGPPATVVPVTEWQDDGGAPARFRGDEIAGPNGAAIAPVSKRGRPD